MAYIELGNELPGIMGLLAYRKETAKPLTELAQILLRGDNTLTKAQREAIAARVSLQNNCKFCFESHHAAAKHLGLEEEGISEKLHSLLMIADQIKDQPKISEEYIRNAKDQGATDMEIHDTILIASAFCMFNRYVDGLATFSDCSPEVYDEMGKKLAESGYAQ